MDRAVGGDVFGVVEGEVPDERDLGRAAVTVEQRMRCVLPRRAHAAPPHTHAAAYNKSAHLAAERAWKLVGVHGSLDRADALLRSRGRCEQIMSGSVADLRARKTPRTGHDVRTGLKGPPFSVKCFRRTCLTFSFPTPSIRLCMKSCATIFFLSRLAVVQDRDNGDFYSGGPLHRWSIKAARRVGLSDLDARAYAIRVTASNAGRRRRRLAEAERPPKRGRPARRTK